MITILGADGFIGSQLVRRIEELSVAYQAIGRTDVLPAGNLGHVIYCIGLTADFRSRPLETVEAHVCNLLQLLRATEFESLLYLSSTRVYAGSDSTHERQALLVRPESQNDLYNISKVMGESLVLSCGRPTRVARISNVYGPDLGSDNFLTTVLKQVVNGEKIVLHTAPESTKDYINVGDVVDGLIQIAARGRERIYNVASGVNVSHRDVAQKLRRLTGCEIEFERDAPVVRFPPINIERMHNEFNFAPSSILDELPHVVRLCEENRNS